MSLILAILLNYPINKIIVEDRDLKQNFHYTYVMVAIWDTAIGTIIIYTT